MEQGSASSRRRPGRPAKFGRPSRVVAFTLPDDAIDRLRQVHRDVGWAIVKLLDTQSVPRPAPKDVPHDVELVTVADRRALIVVNQEVIRNLPGVNIIPLGGNRAFLALDIDRGLSDLELATMDRLTDGPANRREREALTTLQAQLRTWRRDQALRFHTRAIIVVERVAAKNGNGDREPVARPRKPRTAARPRAAAAAATTKEPVISLRQNGTAGNVKVNSPAMRPR
jgi:hypothetical protein